MLPSTIPYLELVSTAWFGTIFIAFGALYILHPSKALSFFELPYPHAPPSNSPSTKEGNSSDPAPISASTSPQKILDCLCVVIGIRDIFIGVAIYVAAMCGSREVLGWMMLAAGGVAATDGAVCWWMVGKGAGNHWGYAPVMMGLGGVMLRGFDWVPLGGWL